MTFETCINRDWYAFTGMAILASISIGFVQDIADQCRSVAAMRVVTGTAVAKFSRKVGMLLPHRSKRVATQTKRLRLLDQKVGVGRLMRLVAGGALSLGVGRMGILELLWHPGVAVEADARGTLTEQSGHIRGMRIVAVQALSLSNRSMYHALQFIYKIGVAGVTQVLYLLLQQAAEFGNMGVVAGEAITLGCRLMIHPFLKNITIMAGKTVNRRRSYPLAHQQQEQGRG